MTEQQLLPISVSLLELSELLNNQSLTENHKLIIKRMAFQIDALKTEIKKLNINKVGLYQPIESF